MTLEMNRMKLPMKLSATDHAVLDSYKSVLDGLSLFLGEGFEFVLHSLEDLDRSAIKVVNGHYSKRSEGAPITDLAMTMLQEIKQGGDIRKNMVYVNQNRGKFPIKSATLPVIGQGERIIGLLCINLHMSIPLGSFLESFFGAQGGTLPPVTENYAANSELLITSAIEAAREDVQGDPNIAAVNQNKTIVSLLSEKGIFELKDAVNIVANELKVSKNTVYLHIRNSAK